MQIILQQFKYPDTRILSLFPGHLCPNDRVKGKEKKYCNIHPTFGNKVTAKWAFDIRSLILGQKWNLLILTLVPGFQISSLQKVNTLHLYNIGSDFHKLLVLSLDEVLYSFRWEHLSDYQLIVPDFNTCWRSRLVFKQLSCAMTTPILTPNIDNT